LKRIQHRIGVTTVFVTHDQSEALAMSDRVVVMSNGRVEQTGTPEEVYNTPATEFVARFLGASNIIEARCTGVEGGAVELEAPDLGRVAVPKERAPELDAAGDAKLVIRAEKLQLVPPGDPGDGMIGLPGIVETVDYQGQAARYFVRVGDRQLQAINMIEEHPFSEGESVTVQLRPRDCAALPGDA
jgi:putative spermidine/putrescine transport system ATP-binding protein/spermidine/putrescine transport system ATP-binding protein